MYHKLFLEYYEVYLVFCKRGPFLFGLLWRHSFKVNSRLSIVVGFRFVRGAGELIFKIFERMRQKKDEWGPWNKKVMSKKWNGKIMYQPTYAFLAVTARNGEEVENPFPEKLFLELLLFRIISSPSTFFLIITTTSSGSSPPSGPLIEWLIHWSF